MNKDADALKLKIRDLEELQEHTQKEKDEL